MIALLALLAMQYDTPDTDAVPPARFQSYNVTVRTQFLARSGVDKMCGTKRVACTTMDRKLVIMPSPCIYADKEYYAKILCHELGHVNGWGGNHEH